MFNFKKWLMCRGCVVRAPQKSVYTVRLQNSIIEVSLRLYGNSYKVELDHGPSVSSRRAHDIGFILSSD